MAHQRLRLRGDSIRILRNGRLGLEGDRVMQIEGDFDFEVEDLESYVQVRVHDHGGTFTYRDPSGSLRPDDIVHVPFGSRTMLGTVLWLGRGGWTGYTKDVKARLLTEELVAA